MRAQVHFWMTALWAASVGAGVVLILSWLWQRQQADSAGRPPVDIIETRLAETSGRTIWLELKALRQRDCALTATTQWQGSDHILNSLFNPNKAVLSQGQSRWIRLRLDLPDSTRPGNYLVRSVAEYLCPDGKTFIVPTAWMPVEVVP